MRHIIHAGTRLGIMPQTAELISLINHGNETSHVCSKIACSAPPNPEWLWSIIILYQLQRSNDVGQDRNNEGRISSAQAIIHKQQPLEVLFIVLNDHCLSYCSERHNFELPDGNLLLTSGTRVYYQQEDDGASVIRIETGVEVLLFRGKDESEMKEWKRYVNLSQL